MDRRVILYSLRTILQLVLATFADDQGMKSGSAQLLGTVEDRLGVTRTLPSRRVRHPAPKQ